MGPLGHEGQKSPGAGRLRHGDGPNRHELRELRERAG